MKAKDEIARLQAKLDSGDIHPDEPLFCLRGQDITAAAAVREWVALAGKVGVPEDKRAEALNLAETMERWPCQQIPGRPATRTGNRPV